MGYNMKRGVAPKFKELGSSPAKDMQGDGTPQGTNHYHNNKHYDGMKHDKYGNWIEETKETKPKPKPKPKSPAKQKPGGIVGEALDHWQEHQAKIREANKIHHKVTKGPDAMKSPKNAKVSKSKQLKKLVKKYAPKVLKQLGKRLGPVGAAITATEIAMTIPEATKALQEGLKKEAKKRSKGKATDLFTGPKY